MSNGSQRVFLDSCIIIDILTFGNASATDPYHKICADIRQAIDDKRLHAITSYAAQVECYQLKDFPGQPGYDLLDQFFSDPLVDVLNVDEPVATDAVKLRRIHPITNFDSILIATAHRHGISLFVTNDGNGSTNPKPLIPLSGKLYSSLTIISAEDFHANHLWKHGNQGDLPNVPANP